MDRTAVLKALDVSRETSERLTAYVELLQKWQKRINLVADSTLTDIWRRHVLDSAQLVRIAPTDARCWVDLGSGAGLPGLILAILLRERQGASVTLIEANHKKCAFLHEAIRVADAPARVIPQRIEMALTAGGVDSCDVVTARALAPLPQLLGWASPLLTKGALGLFLKGQDVDVELTEAAKSWTMDVELLPSQTDPHGRILCVRALASRQPT